MAASAENAPLILTLALDERAQSLFDALRRAHFPPERNVIPAHLTLFHHLSTERERAVVADIVDACAWRSPLKLRTTGPRLLGRGVAYAIDAPELTALRQELAGRWWPWLGAQDRQPFRPHVTVQNKVSPERARALYEQLRGEFTPSDFTGEGLRLWRYLGGPWRQVRMYPFQARRIVSTVVGCDT